MIYASTDCKLNYNKQFLKIYLWEIYFKFDLYQEVKDYKHWLLLKENQCMSLTSNLQILLLFQIVVQILSSEKVCS